jgi:hypothetical protein
LAFGSKRGGGLAFLREDLIVWSHRYLRDIRKFRNEGRPIFFLDETWCNAGSTAPKAWFDTNVKCKRQAFLEGVTTGLRDPIGKGERLIHVGNENGFLDGADLVFRTSGNRADYHGDMNEELFEKWFNEELIPRLPPRAVIVMDNVSYHIVSKWRSSQPLVPPR